MPLIETVSSSIDFSPLHERMQSYVQHDILSCVNSLVMRGTEVLDFKTFGFMDLETRRPLTDDAIYRMYSNTKIVTSVALMILFEQGRFALDDPLSEYMPKFRNLRVLTADAKTKEDSLPSSTPIRIRHILSHSAGLSYGFIEPTSVVDRAYMESKINALGTVDGQTLENLCDGLATMPLAYEPGTSWRYSFATDVCARLVEVLSGQRFDDYLKAKIFRPLGMVDTDFYVPKEKQSRFTSMYAPLDLMDPMKGGLRLADGPTEGQYSKPKSFLSGGGGLVSTVSDYLRFIQMIVNGGSWQGVSILKPATLALMRTNQLAPGVGVQFPMWAMPNTVFGLGFALKTGPTQDESPKATDEYHWGGMAGTHSWMAPRANLTGMCMTQRMPGFWHPFSHEFKRLAYALAS